MHKTVQPKVNRFKELLCVLQGHTWDEYGATTREDGLILEEYNKCSLCGLENHNRDGYLVNYKEKYETNNKGEQDGRTDRKD